VPATLWRSTGWDAEPVIVARDQTKRIAQQRDASDSSTIGTNGETAPRPRLSKRKLDALVEGAIVDAYGESEQRVGLLSMIQMNLSGPFVKEILGTLARVERGELPLPSPRPVGW
jgi:hypothetical protein